MSKDTKILYIKLKHLGLRDSSVAGALEAFSAKLSSVPSTHTVTGNPASLPFQGIYCFLHSEQTGMSCTDIRADEILKHVKIKTEKLMSVLLTKLNDKQQSKHFAIIHDKTQGVL